MEGVTIATRKKSFKMDERHYIYDIFFKANKVVVNV